MSDNLLLSIVIFKSEVVIVVSTMVNIVGDWGIDSRIVGRIVRSSALHSSSSLSVVSVLSCNFADVCCSWFVWMTSDRVFSESSSCYLLILFEDLSRLSFSLSLSSVCVNSSNLLICSRAGSAIVVSRIPRALEGFVSASFLAILATVLRTIPLNMSISCRNRIGGGDIRHEVAKLSRTWPCLSWGVASSGLLVLTIADWMDCNAVEEK